VTPASLSPKYTKANTRRSHQIGRRRSQLVMTETRFRQGFLLLLATAISAAFVAKNRTFLLTILLAAMEVYS